MNFYFAGIPAGALLGGVLLFRMMGSLFNLHTV